MKRNVIFFLLLSALLALSLAACSEKSGSPDNEAFQPAAGAVSGSKEGQDNPASALTVRFGHGGSSFDLYLEDNDTAAAIARHVGTADWQLPIYHYDDYEGWEVFQYYDIPSRYEIPSNPESVTAEKAGDVYYSAPNRIVLFYHDGEISGEYTLVGHFDATEEFISAVEDNPVLEGWGNKIVNISTGE